MRTSVTAAGALILAAAVRPAAACSVPVFRYALERWTADACEVAVPVFGRGRALAAFYGDYLVPAEVAGACELLVGMCSCQVKAMNPGVDMLFQVGWDALLSGACAVDDVLPPLTGIAAAEEAIAATAGARRGRFPGMLKRRTVRVVLVRPGRGVGIAPSRGSDAKVTYTDRRCALAFART